MLTYVKKSIEEIIKQIIENENVTSFKAKQVFIIRKKILIKVYYNNLSF